MKKITKFFYALALLFVVTLTLNINASACTFKENPIGKVPTGEQAVGQVLVSVEDLLPAPPNQSVNKPNPQGVIIQPTWIDIYPSDSMMSAIVRATNAQRKCIEIGVDGRYIQMIDDLAEFDRGNQSGWNGSLNDWITNKGFSEITVAKNNEVSLEDGDIIKIMYTVSGLGSDLGGSLDNNDKRLKSLSFNSGKLNKSFNNDLYNYDLSINPNVKDLQVKLEAINKNFQVKLFLNNEKNEFKRSKAIPIKINDKIIIKIGDPSYPTFNWFDESPAKVYTINIIDSNKEQAQVIIDLINRLPEANKLTLNDKAKVNEAKQAYDKASNEVKALINSTLVNKLNNSLNKIKDLEAAAVKPKPLPKNKTEKKGNTTNYYVLNKNNKYDLVKQVIVAGKKTTTKEYKIISGKNYVTKQVIKQGNKVETKQYKVIKNSNKVIRHTKVDKYKNKNIATYDNTISYYTNGRVSVNTKTYRALKTNKITSRNKIKYKNNGKKTSQITIKYNNGKTRSRIEYAYNKAGELKSNKNGKAYYYTTSYNKKGKANKTIRKQYNAKGKLIKKAVNVKKRTSF